MQTSHRRYLCLRFLKDLWGTRLHRPDKPYGPFRPYRRYHVRKVAVGLLGISLAATSGLAWGAPALGAAPVRAPSTAPSAGEPSVMSHDDLPNPQEDKRRALRQAALTDVLAGRAKPVTRNGSTVVKVGSTAGPSSAARTTAQRRKAQYVELSREKTDKIFVVLAEFGNERHPDYPDQDTDPATPRPARFDGPAHHEIPAPNRAVGSST